MIKLSSDLNYVVYFAMIPNAMRVEKHDRKKGTQIAANLQLKINPFNRHTEKKNQTLSAVWDCIWETIMCSSFSCAVAACVFFLLLLSASNWMSDSEADYGERVKKDSRVFLIKCNKCVSKAICIYTHTSDTQIYEILFEIKIRLHKKK